MSLIEDLKRLENEGLCRGLWEYKDSTNSEIVQTEYLSHNRWDVTCRTILRRGVEYVSAIYREPCADGDWDEYNDIEFSEVSPEREEVTVYV